MVFPRETACDDPLAQSVPRLAWLDVARMDGQHPHDEGAQLDQELGGLLVLWPWNLLHAWLASPYLAAMNDRAAAHNQQ